MITVINDQCYKKCFDVCLLKVFIFLTFQTVHRAYHLSQALQPPKHVCSRDLNQMGSLLTRHTADKNLQLKVSACT